MVSDGAGDLRTVVRRAAASSTERSNLRNHYAEVIEELYRLNIRATRTPPGFESRLRMNQ